MVCFFVVYPVIKVIAVPTAGEYAQLFSKGRWLSAIKNSLMMTVLSTITCTMVAFLFAYVNVRLDVPCKGLFRFIALLPIVSPPFIIALSYILLFGVNGIITSVLLGIRIDIYGRIGLWIVQTVTFFPYAYSVIYGVMGAISPNLEYAAYNMQELHKRGLLFGASVTVTTENMVEVLSDSFIHVQLAYLGFGALADADL